MNAIPYNIHYEWRVIHDGIGKTPNIRSSSCSWCYKDSLWLVAGASSGLGKANEVWRFDLQSKVWIKIEGKEASVPNGRDGHCGAYIGNGKFVIFGGQGFPEPNQKLGKESEQLKTQTHWKRDVFNDLWQFDCNTLQWTPIYPDGLSFPMGRRGASCIFIKHLKMPLYVTDSATDHSSNKRNFSKIGSTGDDLAGTSIDSAIKRGGKEALAASSSHSSTLSKSASHTRSHPHATATTGVSDNLNSSSANRNNGDQIPLENCLVIFGGAGIELSKYTEQLYNDLWVFSFDRNVWIRYETKGVDPVPVTDHKVYKLDDRMVVMGGITDTAPRAGPASTNNQSISDIQVLNLQTLTWSFLPLHNASSQDGQLSTKLNLHGFSIVPDQVYPPTPLVFNPHPNIRRASSPPTTASSSVTPQLIVFGGNQVLDTKTAIHSKNMKPLKEKSSQEATLLLNLEDGSLTPLLLKGDLFPENRYLHTSISSTPCHVELHESLQEEKKGSSESDNHSVISLMSSSITSNKPPESSRKSFLPGVGGIDLRVEEVVSYLYGGSNIEFGGYCDPQLFALYRIKTIDPMQLRSSNTPSQSGASVSSTTNLNKSTSNRAQKTAQNVLSSSGLSVELPPNGSSLGYDNSYGEDAIFGSPSEHQYGSRRGFGVEEGESYEDRDYSTSSIWVNMQNKTKDDYRNKTIRPPNNWEEFKLSLTFSRSQKGLLDNRVRSTPTLPSSSANQTRSSSGLSMKGSGSIASQSVSTSSLYNRPESFPKSNNNDNNNSGRNNHNSSGEMNRNMASRSASRQRQEAELRKVEFMKQSKAFPFIQKYQTQSHDSLELRTSESRLLLDYKKNALGHY